MRWAAGAALAIRVVSFLGVHGRVGRAIQRLADAAIEQDSTGGVIFAIAGPDGDVLGASAGEQLGGTPIPLNGSFRIGSVTKLKVGTAILRLVDSGVLELSNVLPEEILAPHHGAITTQRVLRHPTGVPDYVDPRGSGIEFGVIPKTH